MPTDEREDVMEFTNSWREEGLAKGLEQNRHRMAATLLGLLRRRVGEVPEAVGARVENLPIERLEQLAGALLDFTASADLERWLERD